MDATPNSSARDHQAEATAAGDDDDGGSAVRRLCDLFAPSGENELVLMFRRCAAIEELHRRNLERSTKALNDWYELKAVLHSEGLRWSAAPASGEEDTPAAAELAPAAMATPSEFEDDDVEDGTTAVAPDTATVEPSPAPTAMASELDNDDESDEDVSPA